MDIHGGPESQSHPDFLARWNFLPCELGIAVFFPNVRGSMGYGKTFVALDNGFHREDAVRDIGAFIAALKKDAGLDPGRFAVMGGSYGGYMTLATLIHHGAELRCGVDIVGISNFLTFLKNTQDYRRDLRRVEYGDERDPATAEFLAKIAPTARAAEIKRPLFIVQGKNDPRVPFTEARQMADAVRKAGGKVWYLEASDEGHGFAKKRNVDFLFLSTIEFFKEHLLK
jgi:dipeptidyl aminopeptidase/acylaminoacyl peptidase